jgi:hypothetical protein
VVPALSSPVDRRPPGSVIVGKDPVDRARGAPRHRAFGDKLHAGRSRRGVVCKVAVKQVEVVVRPRRAADSEAVLPVHSVTRAGSSQDIVTISKPPSGLGVGKVEVFGVAARVDSDEGTCGKDTIRRNREEKTLSPAIAEVRVLNQREAVVSRPQLVKARGDYLYEGRGEAKELTLDSKERSAEWPMWTRESRTGLPDAGGERGLGEGEGSDERAARRA